MTIARRLIILLAVPLLVLVALGVFVRQQLFQIERATRFVSETQLQSLSILYGIDRSFNETRVQLRNFLLAGDTAEQLLARDEFDRHRGEAFRQLNEYANKYVSSDRDRRLMGEYRSLLAELARHADSFIEERAAGRPLKDLAGLHRQMVELTTQLAEVGQNWIRENSELARQAGQSAIAEIEHSRRDILLAAGLALTLSAILGLLTFRRIVLPIRSLDSAVGSIAAGDYSRAVPFTQARDETGDLARSIAVLKQGASAMDQQRWIKSNESKITCGLPGASTLEEFGQRLLSELVPVLGGGVGAFYVVEPPGGELRRVGAFGLSAEALASLRLRAGEGLAGQCALERQTIRLSGIPPSYLKIGSSLGSATPGQAVAFPVVTQDTLLAVLEFASFRPLKENEEALLQELLPVVALSLGILQRNLRTQELLAQTQEQARQLEEQTDELTQSQQELMAQKDELLTQQRELAVAKKKAEEATEMKSMFLANMSHEIRTPMNAIIGLTHLALKTPLNAKQRDYLSKVHNAGTSLLSIINDILDFSKIEAGKLDIEQTDFQIDDVISSVTLVTAQKAHDKGLEFLADVSSSIPPSLVGDPLRLGQILTNLVNNAVKFTEQGEIRLKIELVERTGEKVQLKFSVRDTGVGMSREQAAKLFQPFTQADMSTTRKHGGTGLGLTISRRLVELMGGRIWLESEPGIGSTFAFTAWLGVGEESGSRKLVPEKLGHLRILVVDDNSAAREILQEPLRSLAERVDTVASGAEALEAIKVHDATDPYDIVFMDWRMPGLDGLQTSRRIKSDETLSKQPAIVLVTAFGREEVREEAERLHLDGFLVKPVTKSMIVDTLVNVFAEPTDGISGALTGGLIEPAPLTGVRLLLTEDNEINQQIAVELLEGAGASVQVANNGREAVDVLFKGPQPPPFDAVLMDLQMPEMDGHQATIKIRSEPRFAALPIIAMTAHATMEERQRCLDEGMNDHLSKPIDPALLFETVGRHTRGREVIASAPAAATATPPAAGEPETPLPEAEGLDTRDGLSRVAGNRKLYLKLLGQFAEHQAEAPAQIADALSKGDTGLAERLVHTLKGVAGNIGAKAVQAVAGELEKRIRDGRPADEVEAARREALTVLEPLLRQLASARPASPSTPPTAANPATLDPVRARAAVEEMARLLTEFDATAVDVLESRSAELSPLFNPDEWSRFRRAVEGYSFGDALTQLTQVALEKGIQPA